jgi:membrane protein
MEETRIWVITRLQSILFVILGAAGLLALAFLVVLAPAAMAAVSVWAPDFERFARQYDLIRFAATTFILLAGLTLAHLWLPSGKRTLGLVWPGIALTLVAWLAAALSFAAYLARFSTYASTYAGFAGAMIALVFLYFLSVIFIVGGEFNAAIEEERRDHGLT